MCIFIDKRVDTSLIKNKKNKNKIDKVTKTHANKKILFKLYSVVHLMANKSCKNWRISYILRKSWDGSIKDVNFLNLFNVTTNFVIMYKN